jgi:succinate dehydrogenase/fumarate reductase flavoprotein subunit
MPDKTAHADVDVVVVGFGFAGAAAAIEAADAGARVLLIEKMAQPGGISACSAGGVRITRDPDASFEYLKATNAGTTPDDVLRTLADGMAGVAAVVEAHARQSGAVATINWRSGNYPFPGHDSFGFVSITELPGVDLERTFPHLRGLRGGARLFKVMQDAVAARQIPVRLQTRADRLLRDSSGTVSGLLAEGPGGRLRIEARGGVILACGGFEADPVMQAQYWQEKPVLPGAFRGNTGDGIRMAQAVGADLWHMWHYHGTYGLRHVDPAYPYGIRLTRLPDWLPGTELDPAAEVPAFFGASQDPRMPWIVLDQDGRRFMNEYPPYLQDTGHRWLAPFDPVRRGYPRIPAWLVVDDDGRRHAPLGFPTRNDPDVDLVWSQDNLAEIERGILGQAGSIEVLSERIGAPLADLRATLDQWNASCEAGFDDAFGRMPASMMPIRRPPFVYAQLWPICANTQGGPRHDPRQRVLDPFGEVIVGLYAAGELGSAFGHLYLSGGNLAECFIGGRIAGQAAADRASKARV